MERTGGLILQNPQIGGWETSQAAETVYGKAGLEAATRPDALLQLLLMASLLLLLLHCAWNRYGCCYCFCMEVANPTAFAIAFSMPNTIPRTATVIATTATDTIATLPTTVTIYIPDLNGFRTVAVIRYMRQTHSTTHTASTTKTTSTTTETSNTSKYYYHRNITTPTTI